MPEGSSDHGTPARRRTPPEVADGLRELDAAPVFVRLVDELAALTEVTSDGVVSGYVGVRPAVNGTISVYVHRTSISLALEPDQARAAAERYGGSLQKKNPTTWFLRLSSNDLEPDARFVEVVGLGAKALSKSLAGPVYEGGGESARSYAAARQICGACRQYELAANGTCMCGHGDD